MLDPQILRTNTEETAKKLAQRGYQLDLATWNELEKNRKHYQVLTEKLQNQRTVASKSIGQAKAKGENIQPLMDSVKNLGDEVGQADRKSTRVNSSHITI